MSHTHTPVRATSSQLPSPCRHWLAQKLTMSAPRKTYNARQSRSRSHSNRTRENSRRTSFFPLLQREEACCFAYRLQKVCSKLTAARVTCHFLNRVDLFSQKCCTQRLLSIVGRISSTSRRNVMPSTLSALEAPPRLAMSAVSVITRMAAAGLRHGICHWGLTRGRSPR